MNYSEDKNKQYHIQVGKEDVGHYVILPGEVFKVFFLDHFALSL